MAELNDEKEMIFYKQVIEAILFVKGEPVPVQEIAKFLKLDKQSVVELISELRNEYEMHNHGLSIIEMDDKVQMVTNKKVGETIEKYLLKDFSQKLSPILLETLTIIAYKGPISRSEIERIRGVNSDYPLRVLLLRGLIDRESHPTIPHAYLYKVSFRFLKYLGLSSIKELPKYEEIRRELSEQ